MGLILSLVCPSFQLTGLGLIKGQLVKNSQTTFLPCGEMCSITMTTS